jgi:hypothetical protein
MRLERESECNTYKGGLWVEYTRTTGLAPSTNSSRAASGGVGGVASQGARWASSASLALLLAAAHSALVCTPRAAVAWRRRASKSRGGVCAMRPLLRLQPRLRSVLLTRLRGGCAHAVARTDGAFEMTRCTMRSPKSSEACQAGMQPLVSLPRAFCPTPSAGMLAMSHPQHHPNSMGYAPTSSAPGALPLPGGLEGLNPYHPLAFWPHPMYMGQQQGMGQGVVMPRPHLLGSNAKEQHPGPLVEEPAELGKAQDGSPVPGSRGAKASTYAARHQVRLREQRGQRLDLCT